jgi:hypothetical protein
MGLC